MKELELEDIKKIELNMIEYLDKICRKNNINYFLIGGSLLGAVRHNGFIPWDDDVDIVLKREDYDKLIEILSNKNNDKYILLDKQTEPSYFYPYAKLVDKNTTWERKNCKVIKNYGIYIDIFVFDNLPNNKLKRNIICIRKKFLKKLISIWATVKINDRNLFVNVIRRILKLYSEKLGIKKILSKYDKIHEKYNKMKTNYVISNWPCYSIKKEIYKTSLYDETIDHKFENLVVKIPKHYDEILTHAYGDYMTLPPEEKRVSLHYGNRYWREEKSEKKINSL